MYIPIGTPIPANDSPDTMSIPILEGYLIYGKAITDIICSLVKHVNYNLNCAP